jgi:hypothetical protein
LPTLRTGAQCEPTAATLLNPSMPAILQLATLLDQLEFRSPNHFLIKY